MRCMTRHLPEEMISFNEGRTPDGTREPSRRNAGRSLRSRLMPPDLRKAHQAHDRAVDRFYPRPPFASERERVEHLFTLYKKCAPPSPSKASPNAKPDSAAGGMSLSLCTEMP